MRASKFGRWMSKAVLVLAVGSGVAAGVAGLAAVASADEGQDPGWFVPDPAKPTPTSTPEVPAEVREAGWF